MTMRAFTQVMGMPFTWGPLTEFKHSVVTGKPAIETMTGGRERTVDQLRNLFEGAGFDLSRVIDTTSSMQIVEARAT
jgi:hypothetical protein